MHELGTVSCKILLPRGRTCLAFPESHTPRTFGGAEVSIPQMERILPRGFVLCHNGTTVNPDKVCA